MRNLIAADAHDAESGRVVSGLGLGGFRETKGQLTLLMQSRIGGGNYMNGQLIVIMLGRQGW